MCNLYNFYIPDLEYLYSHKKLAFYIIENISNYSLFNSLAKLVLNGVIIKAYYFDEVLVTSSSLDKKIVTDSFKNNNKVPLSVKIKTF